MVGAISGFSTYYSMYPSYGAARNQSAQQTDQAQGVQKTGGVWTARRASNPEIPVEPVRPVGRIAANKTEPAGLGVPIREGADPVEMAVRMRIQYPGQNNGAEEAAKIAGLSGTDAVEGGEAVQGAEGAQKAAEEGKCETCEKRKYQDGSDDPGVSFKTPTRVAPELAASAVRGHEMEHVVREQAKAQREDRKVVSQTVTYHTEICPECGKAYISGGTTRTVTAADNAQQDTVPQNQESQQRTPFSAVA